MQNFTSTFPGYQRVLASRGQSEEPQFQVEKTSNVPISGWRNAQLYDLIAHKVLTRGISGICYANKSWSFGTKEKFACRNS